MYSEGDLCSLCMSRRRGCGSFLRQQRQQDTALREARIARGCDEHDLRGNVGHDLLHGIHDGHDLCGIVGANVEPVGIGGHGGRAGTEADVDVHALHIVGDAFRGVQNRILL